MKATVKYLIYSVTVVLFLAGSYYLVKYHPEVQFAFYIPGFMIVLYAVIYDDLFARPHHLSALRELRAAKGK
ncbi:hypothetical protein KHS38_19120 [Mucilaginibacter sp. Bleaf8]|uniref:hypothetical protein n=1 Tax=Mucilaginibacter sp. Bleaf8 TaxID=2834430 RepID=UPI001BD04AFF|nr:hypothetical protein [Mucilaginibacter sp. Bleaf8]MBS7566524.1 hypothetical protein [Mucilaginibacter sp. Bleaf8]